MTSLYNRASPPQARVLRIIEGAIKNAADAHDEIRVSPRHRRSIAKRAAGTLTAQWPDVLAASRRSGSLPMAKGRPSPKARRQFNTLGYAALLRLTMERAAGEHTSHDGGAGAPDSPRPPPLLGLAEMALWKTLGPLRKIGDEEAYDVALALVKLLGRRRKGLSA